MKIVLITCLFLVFACKGESAERIINGTLVPAGAFTEVVKIKVGSTGCSASIVGPRVLLTAGHCAKSGSTATFTLGVTDYSAVLTRHPDYPGKDIDVNVGLIDKDLPRAVTPVTIQKEAIKVGDTIKIFGFGCTQEGGTGGDGLLREGNTTVTGFSGYDIVSRLAGGAALCYGDSGGPAYYQIPRATEKGVVITYQQVAINSKGNIKDTNYTTALAGKETQDFLLSWATQNKAEICGINKDCGAPQPETFDVDGKACNVHVVSKGVHQVEYLKTYFGYLMSYLDGGNSMILPLPKTGDVPRGFCNCGNGTMAACMANGSGLCGTDLSCFCEGTEWLSH